MSHDHNTGCIATCPVNSNFFKTTVDLKLEIQPALKLSSLTGTLGAIVKQGPQNPPPHNRLHVQEKENYF